MRQGFRHSRFAGVLPALAITTIGLALAPLESATAAYTFKRLHSFCSHQGGGRCLDGAEPAGRLVMDKSGNLYGTTSAEGKHGAGLVYKLTPNSDKSRYTETVLHNFCTDSLTCPDGAFPQAGVILDVDGNLYGTTPSGGDKGGGEVFKLTHGSKGWTLSILKSFCDKSNCDADGDTPTAGLSYAGQDAGKAWNESSPLFGTTDTGGTYHKGVVFQLTSGGSYFVIHNFKDSSIPNEVLVDNADNIYGTTQFDGKYGGGLLYKLESGTWSPTVLHNFCNLGSCADGGWPQGRLAMDASGNLFGSTFAGGSNFNDVCEGHNGGNCGVVFERSSAGTYSVIYNFCSQANCADGASPEYGVIIDGSGNLFGTTLDGGAYASNRNRNGGTMYELSGGTESVLHSFCSSYQNQVCTDGFAPTGVIPDSAGGFLGMTTYGGTHDAGEVFRLGP